MRNTLSYALLTEIGKVLIILTVLMVLQYVRHEGAPDASPRALTQAEADATFEPLRPPAAAAR